MEELVKLSDIELAAEGDGQLVWAAQGRPDGDPGADVRAWRHGTALVVASPNLSGRDRLAVRGDIGDAAPLVQHALDVVGPSYRVFGRASLISALPDRLARLGPVGNFYWMDTMSVPAPVAPAPDVEWLDGPAENAAASLFDHFSDSYAQPGRSGVRRWAGVLGDTDGTGPHPISVAAEAWSAEGCGFLAGVVTHPAARGRRLAQAVCEFIVGVLVRRYGRAALMVHADNSPAITAYERLGMTKRLLGATDVAQG